MTAEIKQTQNSKTKPNLP